MKHLLKIFLFAVLPLGIGTCIYFMDRRGRVPLLIRDYLPDFLWAFAFTSAWFFTFNQDERTIRSLIPCSLIIVSVEFSQLFHFIPGTFDQLDIVVMLSASLLSFFLFHTTHLQTKTRST